MSARQVSALAVVLLALAPGCGGTPPATDAGSDSTVPMDAAPECHAAIDCDDGLFCNGAESCSAEGRCVLGAPMRCDDSVACTTDRCSEDLRRCVYAVPDVDMDGTGDAACVDGTGTALGTDCADDDANRFPGNHEICDAAMHDEDCDDTTHGGIDADGDGIESATCCNGTPGSPGAQCGADCNDGRRDVHPGAVEVCNLVDDDCNGNVDEGVTITVYTDGDHDGDGAMSAAAMQACASTAGVSVYHTDCDDADRARSGRLIEVCDSIDNDCDGTPDDNTSDVPWYRDVDGDGFGSAASGTLVSCIPPTGYSLYGTDCDDTTNTRSPARAEICDGLDDDCNGAADFVIASGNLEDDDGDGIADLMCGAPYGHDCDDTDPTSSPGTPETCDGRDNDCDMHVDEDAQAIAFFRDVDGDGYGSDTSGTIVGCVPSAGYVRLGGDCDDANDARHPGSPEGCNATDDDCDGAIDEGSASAMCTIAHTQEACIAGICSQVSCDSGYADCSFLTAGCETSLATDPQNCGRCGTSCGMLGTCTAGVCSSAPTAGLVAHYDARVASSFMLGTGSTVMSWHDLSGAGNDLAVFDGTPVLTSSLIGSHPAVDFASAGMVTAPFSLNSEVTVFFVMQERTSGQWGSLGHHGNRDYDWAMEQNDTNQGLMHFQTSNDNGGTQVTLATGTSYVLVGRMVQAPSPLREIMAISSGGTLMDSASTSTTIAPMPQALHIGCSDGLEHSNAYIGEVLYYDHALTDPQRDAVIAYLRAGWGI